MGWASLHLAHERPSLLVLFGRASGIFVHYQVDDSLPSTLAGDEKTGTLSDVAAFDTLKKRRDDFCFKTSITGYAEGSWIPYVLEMIQGH